MMVLFNLLLLSLFATCAVAVWPKPVESSFGSTTLWLSPNVTIVQSDPPPSTGTYSKYVDFKNWFHLHTQFHLNNRRSSSLSESGILTAAIQRTQSLLTQTNFIPWKFHPRNDNFEPNETTSSTQISHITIYQGSTASNATVRDFISGDESYSLEISTNGTASIYTNATIGSIRALQTLEQLFYVHSSTGTTYTPYAPISIFDYPKWSHRGLNLDIARNVFGPNDVKRTLDAMATAKFSRMHIHATDSQSWPIVIPSFPTLASEGAYQPYLVWSPTDLAEVQQYGLERGISVFIEIDMPGHTASIAHAFPDLIAAFNEFDWDTFAGEPPSGQLKLNSTAVDTFIEDLLADLLPRVSPYTSYFHTGGDEVNSNVYLLDENVGSNDSSVLQPLIQKFVSHAQSLVQDAGLHPIAWEEMLLDWNLTMTPANSSTGLDTLIQVWESPADLLLVLQRGYRAIFGDYTEWYLDCGHGQWLNPYPSGFSPPGIPVNTSGGVPTQIVQPYVDYCDPLKNWRHIYVYDPLVNITEDLQPLIVGGEVHMWSEQVDATSMDGIIWPRAASAAEVLWSGPQNASGLVDATPRLGEWRERVVLDHGVPSGTVTMDICLMGETNCEF